MVADAAVEAPPADVPIEVATVNELSAWRSTALPGSQFLYYAGPASLARTRSRDVAVDEIGAAVWSMYMTGRCVPLARYNGRGWVYVAQATNNAPVKERI